MAEGRHRLYAAGFADRNIWAVRELPHTPSLTTNMTHADLKVDQPTAINVEFPKETIDSLKTLLKLTKLPNAPPINTTPAWKLGIDLSWLSQLKATFESDAWKADTLLDKINSWPNYLVRMKASDDADEAEFVDLHFMHIKSNKPNAIPLLMLHGWPGMLIPKRRSRTYRRPS